MTNLEQAQAAMKLLLNSTRDHNYRNVAEQLIERLLSLISGKQLMIIRADMFDMLAASIRDDISEMEET